jgi:hypothetical protein
MTSRNSKPRKRRQPKPVETDNTHWLETSAGYYLTCGNVDARLTRTLSVWQMRVRIDKQWYAGTRTSLEEAFKAADRLIYLKAKDVWLKSKCTAAIAPWVGNLNGGTL